MLNGRFERFPINHTFIYITTPKRNIGNVTKRTKNRFLNNLALDKWDILKLRTLLIR